MKGWPILGEKWDPPPDPPKAQVSDPPAKARIPHVPSERWMQISAGQRIDFINFTAPEDGYLVFVPKAAKPQ